MFSLLKIALTGLLISFLGALPLGSLNIAAMQIALEENKKNAFAFALGVAIVEIAYVRISLQAMDWVMEHQQLFYSMEWITVAIFLILAGSSFWVAFKKQGAAKNILLNNKINRFWLGLSMSAINPVQIPFWFIWSTYLLSNKVLLPTQTQFNSYTMGIGVGTITALAIFIYAGSWLVTKLNTSQKMINFVVGVVLLVSAIIQLYKVINNPYFIQV
jgi:threonine/homoserine/homoserine lactone efflux protein